MVRLYYPLPEYRNKQRSPYSTPCPSLVIRGAASDVLDAGTADRMVEEALPDGRLEVVPRAGHSVMLDNPEGFEEAQQDLLRN